MVPSVDPEERESRLKEPRQMIQDYMDLLKSKLEGKPVETPPAQTE